MINIHNNTSQTNSMIFLDRVIQEDQLDNLSEICEDLEVKKSAVAVVLVKYTNKYKHVLQVKTERNPAFF